MNAGKRGDHHDEEDAKLGAVEPDDRDDHPGQRRDALQEDQERHHVAFDLRIAADRNREQASEDEGAGEPGEDARRGFEHLREFRPVDQDPEGTREHVLHRREQVVRKEVRCDLPGRDQHQRADCCLQKLRRARAELHAPSCRHGRACAACSAPKWRAVVPQRPLPRCGGGIGRGHAQTCASSPPPHPSPASGGGSRLTSDHRSLTLLTSAACRRPTRPTACSADS